MKEAWPLVREWRDAVQAAIFQSEGRTLSWMQRQERATQRLEIALLE